MVGIFLYGSYGLCLIKSTPSRGHAVSLLSKVKWAIRLLSNPRGVGLEWQIKNLPPFSRKDKGYIPSRREFLVQRFSGFVFLYLFDWLYPQILLILFFNVDYDLASSKAHLFSRLSDVLERVYFAVNGFLRLYITHSAAHRLASTLQSCWAIPLKDGRRSTAISARRTHYAGFGGMSYSSISRLVSSYLRTPVNSGAA